MRPSRIGWALALAVAGCGGAQGKTPPPRTNASLTWTAEQKTTRMLDAVRDEPLLLAAFIEQMPKGADLHNHLVGAVYAESLIAFAASDGLCVDKHSFALAPAPCDDTKGLVPASKALEDSSLHRQLVDAFSMREFQLGRESPKNHFFDAFGKFKAVTHAHVGEMIAEVVTRATRKNESYLELSVGLEHGVPAALGAKTGWDDDMARLKETLLANGLKDATQPGRKLLDAAEAKAKSVLGCGAASPPPACAMPVRYIYEVNRGLPKEQVFAQIFAGFETAATDPRVVAVNMVTPEDGYVSMADYPLHMKMFDFFHKLYPKVHITLHAGELAPGMVPPEGMRSHVRDAVTIAHAERIGHGVDVMHEERPLELLKELAAKKIAVEVCLTSNDIILGVSGADHPLPLYLQYGVPVTIATDDEGVSRTDMTQEYVRATQTYALSYADLKMLARSSLRHAFLPEAERAKLEQDLEARFAKFESGF